MTNVQYPVIAAIKTALLGVSGIKFVGEWPDDLSLIGQRFPAVIVEDGNETYDIYTGNQYYCFMDVRVNLFTEAITTKTKMKNMLDLQAEISDAILDDLTLGGACVNIKLTEVPKDTVTNAAGQQISQRIITYKVEIHSTR